MGDENSSTIYPLFIQVLAPFRIYSQHTQYGIFYNVILFWYKFAMKLCFNLMSKVFWMEIFILKVVSLGHGVARQFTESSRQFWKKNCQNWVVIKWKVEIWFIGLDKSSKCHCFDYVTYSNFLFQILCWGFVKTCQFKLTTSWQICKLSCNQPQTLGVTCASNSSIMYVCSVHGWVCGSIGWVGLLG